jgi:diguanylate cyclase (GGDEF)-like protein/PAS domain S-box-containing protein
MFQTAAEKPLILLVDDVPSNLHVLIAALKQSYRIKTATNGFDGLKLASKVDDKPQLILLDVMMPQMSGIEMLRHLRNDPITREIPVIFVSADASEQSQLDGLDLGADDYLTKPVVTSVLLARMRNLLERRQADAQVRLAVHVFEHSGEALLISDRNNLVVEVNPAFERLTGYSADEVKGRDPKFLASGRTSADEYRAMWQAINAHGFWQGEIWDRHKDGSIYPKILTITVVRNSQGSIDYYIASFTDIRAQKAAEERIRYIAHHDPLTGLPNRLHLQIGLEQAIATSRRKREQVAVIFIDMDRFKVINDTLGHTVGDELLVEVAHRLRGCVRENDLVARLGGDEFVIVLAGASVLADATAVSGKVLLALGAVYHIKGYQLHSSPSIGISIYPNDSSSIESLMKHADTAMYLAKEQGRNNVQFFAASLANAASKRMELERDLRVALEAGGEFELFYQPQVTAGDNRVIGAEALLRWRHPKRGLITPDFFIPIAEETHLIQQLGAWVLNEACCQLACWRRAGYGAELRMAVNLSAHQLRAANFGNVVRGVLEQHGLRGEDLELEVTESVAMQQPERAIQQLKELRELGVNLAIDDFGTGYSSLAYLKLLPIQTLKLDRTFVSEIDTDANSAAISAATLALAHSLGLQVVAEGVETESQRQFLVGHGCELLQGYLFGKPQPAGIWLQKWPPWWTEC